MTNPLAIQHQIKHPGGVEDVVSFFCPGCQGQHWVGVGGVPMDGLPIWEWNGRLDEGLTVSPSILCHSSVHVCADEHGPVVCPEPEACDHVGHLIMSEEPRVLGVNTPHTKDPAWGPCHSFLRDGVWQFLGDCAHHLANQSVPMVPVPDWMVR